MKKQLLTLFSVCSSMMALAQIPETGLKAYYSFDNDITSDLTRNYKALTIANRETGFDLNGNGKFGQALLANSTDAADGLYRNDTSLLFTKSLSVSVWIKTGNNNPDAWGTIICNRKNQSMAIYNNYALFVRHLNNNDNVISFTVSDSLLTVPTPIDTAWHHVVVTYNTGNVKIYVDGVLKISNANFPASIAYETPDELTLEGTTQIGNIFGVGNSLFRNLIDEMALYDRALTETEVTNLYNATSNTLVTMAQPWTKIIGGPKLNVRHVTARNNNFIGFIADGQNYTRDIETLTSGQEFYESGIATADYIHISSTGKALIQNVNQIFYYPGAGAYTNITGSGITKCDVNASTAYKIGANNTGIFKLDSINWIGINSSLKASNISVADDETIALLDSLGHPAIGTSPNYTFNFNQTYRFTSIAVKDANLAFATDDNGAVYKYTPSTGWTVFNTMPAMAMVDVASNGALFAISVGVVYKFTQNTTTGLYEPIKQLAFSAYPNPSNGLITVNCPDAIEQINVLNLVGQVVLTGNQQNSINVAGQSKGIYLLQVKAKNGAIGTQKIIITN